jgi:hypothetical protein
VSAPNFCRENDRKKAFLNQFSVVSRSQQRDETERRARGEGGSRRLKISHEDETDEFYDRTALNADESNWRIRKKRQRQPVKTTEAEGESMPTNYKSLEARRRTLEEEAQGIRQRMETVEAAAQESVEAAPESGDALDAYMASNEVRDHRQELEVRRKRNGWTTGVAWITLMAAWRSVYDRL